VAINSQALREVIRDGSMATTCLDDALHVCVGVCPLSTPGVVSVRLGSRLDFLDTKMATKEELLTKLRPFGQEHLLAFWDAMNDESRQKLADQIASIDFAAIQRFAAGKEEKIDWGELARRANSPKAIRLRGTHNAFSAEQARRRGEELLRSGKVGMILVAGGQGTRLGFPQPKGMFPIGPLSQRTLFQVILDRLRAVARRYRTTVPLYLMTSPATHDETVAYFEEQKYLGLAPESVKFFCQGMLPAVERETGRVLLAERDAVALSPDGHGGMLAALMKSGSLADARERGIDVFFYGQVDNPLLQVCDPEFLGYHVLAQSEMTTQVVHKRFPLERVGNVVELDGKTQIIEYSDLPETAAQRANPDGSLALWAGSLAVHAMDVAFLEQQAGHAHGLPIHRALKKVPTIDQVGHAIEPAAANAIKFERFIFDLLPLAKEAFVVEVDPAVAFAPVKNSSQEKVDTPETARATMIHYDRNLLQTAGAKIADGVPVEVNPLWALDPAEAAAKIHLGLQITGPTYFV
jgi:UDP-N-acetylglucosamine/UDP-N-acetylgalactosamine diphosphorylase